MTEKKLPGRVARPSIARYHGAMTTTQNIRPRRSVTVGRAARIFGTPSAVRREIQRRSR